MEANRSAEPKVLEGKLEAKGLRFAIAAARFNSFVVDRMLEGCLDALARHGCDTSACLVVRVPGSFELPSVARKLAAMKGYDAIIALGAVIRGGTPHFEYIAAEVTKGLAQVAMDADKPVAYGVLTTDTIEQAIERAGTKAGNKGFEAATCAIEMANLWKKL
ncbi:MAG: 6,7-dimethyl-8-ribityllumazine synthase [Deltaproteobacteria bacterium]|nr:6,7-dimethyl-8-ribityllumazine synthase [Deltaproteobacteria bacterium]